MTHLQKNGQAEPERLEAWTRQGMQAGPDPFLLNSRLRHLIQVRNQIRLSHRSSTLLRDSGLNWMLKYQDTSCFFFPFPSFLITFSFSFFSIHPDLFHSFRLSFNSFSPYKSNNFNDHVSSHLYRTHQCRWNLVAHQLYSSHRRSSRSNLRFFSSMEVLLYANRQGFRFRRVVFVSLLFCSDIQSVRRPSTRPSTSHP